MALVERHIPKALLTLLTFQSLQSFLEIAKPIRVSCEKHPFSVVPMECGISLLDHGF